MSIINYAHRGASAYYPENTLRSFYAGLEMGADGIETDIQRTKDVVVAYPLWFVLIASISEPVYTNTGKVLLLPKGITFTGYATALNEVVLWRGYLNSIVYTVLYCLIGLTLILPAAFSLSQPKLKLKGLVMTIFMIAMYFNGGLIPTYLLIKGLGMIDSMGP